ncbi:hypothetical protein KIN20_018712 [Parelaphostrongylus tenuis]|uniref:Uncharacterized protein n=1 Tax=Parelaphostrongylus tenuis TaxID=148309 RepID=A0AAD5QSB1_PARTN|nr:hypothetical protein KIN20_018712 [Parelaphostrongylus tenuis]
MTSYLQTKKCRPVEDVAHNRPSSRYDTRSSRHAQIGYRPWTTVAQQENNLNMCWSQQN